MMFRFTNQQREILEGRFKLWNLSPKTKQIRLLERYTALIRLYAPRLSLISKGDIDFIFERHILDSLDLLTLLNKRGNLRLLDIGSGAGLPGIPLAIALPSAEVHLLERSEKKSNFLKSVIFKLRLSNTKSINDTLEGYTKRCATHYDYLLFRGIGNFNSCLMLGSRFMDKGAKIVYFNKRSGILSERYIIYP